MKAKIYAVFERNLGCPHCLLGEVVKDGADDPGGVCGDLPCKVCMVYPEDYLCFLSSDILDLNGDLFGNYLNCHFIVNGSCKFLIKGAINVVPDGEKICFLPQAVD